MKHSASFNLSFEGRNCIISCHINKTVDCSFPVKPECARLLFKVQDFVCWTVNGVSSFTTASSSLSVYGDFPLQSSILNVPLLFKCRGSRLLSERVCLLWSAYVWSWIAANNQASTSKSQRVCVIHLWTSNNFSEICLDKVFSSMELFDNLIELKTLYSKISGIVHYFRTHVKWEL